MIIEGLKETFGDAKARFTERLRRGQYEGSQNRVIHLMNSGDLLGALTEAYHNPSFPPDQGLHLLAQVKVTLAQQSGLPPKMLEQVEREVRIIDEAAESEYRKRVGKI